MAKNEENKNTKKTRKKMTAVRPYAPDLYSFSLRPFAGSVSGFYNQRSRITFTFEDKTFDAKPGRPDGPEYTDLSVKVGATPVIATLVSFSYPDPTKPYIVEAWLYISSTPSPVPPLTNIEVTVTVRKKRTQAHQQP
jgi:hypothetical protein